MKLKIKAAEVPVLAEVKLRQMGYLNLSVTLASTNPLKLEVHSVLGPSVTKEPVPIEQVLSEIRATFDIEG